VHEFRERLKALWDGKGVVSNERLIAQIKEWCQQAEDSGIRVLQEFADTLRGYTLRPAA
jgi:stearoyl-CoA desaturase (delta-9 desaturase)